MTFKEPTCLVMLIKCHSHDVIIIQIKSRYLTALSQKAISDVVLKGLVNVFNDFNTYI